jgi:hypothetical protein
MTLTNVTDQGFSTNLPTKNSKDDLRRVCQNIVTIARDSGANGWTENITSSV